MKLISKVATKNNKTRLLRMARARTRNKKRTLISKCRSEPIMQRKYLVEEAEFETTFSETPMMHQVYKITTIMREWRDVIMDGKYSKIIRKKLYLLIPVDQWNAFPSFSAEYYDNNCSDVCVLSYNIRHPGQVLEVNNGNWAELGVPSSWSQEYSIGTSSYEAGLYPTARSDIRKYAYLKNRRVVI